MKKLLFLLALMVSGVGLSQQAVDVLYYGMLTTTQQNALVVPADRAARIYNNTEGKWKQNIGGAGWTDMISGGGGSGDMEKSTYDADDDGAIDLVDTDAVSTAGLQALSITEAKIADNAITVSKMADNSVSTAEIQNNTVSANDIIQIDQYDIFSRTTSGSGNGTFTGLDIVLAALYPNLDTDSTDDGGGVTDHGALTGLADDDHPQYAEDTDLADYLPLAGGTMTGVLNMGGFSITNTDNIIPSSASTWTLGNDTNPWLRVDSDRFAMQAGDGDWWIMGTTVANHFGIGKSANPFDSFGSEYIFAEGGPTTTNHVMRYTDVESYVAANGDGTGTDDQTAAEVSVAASPSNYTAGSANVEAHLAGIDTALGSVGGGGGDVSVSGTPVNNQAAFWTNSSTIEGEPDVTYDGNEYTVSHARTTQFNKLFTVLVPTGLTTGDQVQFTFGQGKSTYNSAEFSFVYQGDGNISNSMRFGMYGAQAIEIFGSGDTDILNNLDVGDALTVTNGVSATGFTDTNAGTDEILYANGNSGKATGAHIAASTISSSNIADNAISTAKIADGSVTLSKMDKTEAITGHDGDILIVDESGDQFGYLDPTVLGEESANDNRNALLTDADGLVNFTGGGDRTITVQPNATIAHKIGTVLTYRRSLDSSGDVIISYASGVTDEDGNTGAVARTYIPGQTVSIWQTATDVWEVINNPSNDIHYLTVSLTAPDQATATGTTVEEIMVYEDMYLVSIHASVVTAGTGTAITVVDVNEDGSTIMSASKLRIDNTEKNTETASTPAVLSDTFVDALSNLQFDIDQISDSSAAQGLKVTIGYIKGF